MQDKPLRFTRHARNRMRLRRIDRQEIEDTLVNPDAQETTPTGRVNVWKKQAEDYLRIVYTEEEDVRVVITVIFPAKAPKEGTDED